MVAIQLPWLGMVTACKGNLKQNAPSFRFRIYSHIVICPESLLEILVNKHSCKICSKSRADVQMTDACIYLYSNHRVIFCFVKFLGVSGRVYMVIWKPTIRNCS